MTNAELGLSCDHLNGERGVTQKIKQAMHDAAKQFVYIGFLLWEVREYEYYYENNYANVYEYAEVELGFKRSSTKNFIAICENFCKKDDRFSRLPTMFLDERWSDYQYSQLTEMLAMSSKQREQTQPTMTVKQLRKMKKAPKVEQVTIDELKVESTGQTSGQTVSNNGWISVNEGLPKPEKRVLVVCETKKGDRNINLAYWDGNAWHGNGSMAGVTHWMEQPTLPMLKRDQETLQTILVGNVWDDIAPSVIRRLVKKTGMKYNPQGYYRITIDLIPKN